MHLHRKMPKTVEYLKQLNAIEYMGYNKVSDNTFPNLIPMLAGLSFEELQKACWPNYQTRFDNCSFVWSNYSHHGYVTSFAEEQAELGMFNYLKKGFLQQPTDYYWDTLDQQALKETQHWPGGNRKLPVCMGARPMYHVLLTATEKLLTTMVLNKRRIFSFYWDTSLTHNHIDTPSLADLHYMDHLTYINDTGLLNNSLFIFMSDHGYRFGEMAKSHQGHLEDRLPFVFWILPEWFQNKYSTAVANLKQNAYRLTTTFDIHETLNHLLLVDKLENERVSGAVERGERGVSLFRRVSEGRTCERAGIPAHYCTCQEALPVDVEDVLVVRAAGFLVEHVNELLRAYPQCASLKLVRVEQASLATYGGDVYRTGVKTLSDYTVRLVTEPGGALLDATVRCTTCRPRDGFQLTANVDRLNRYDNQSHCVQDMILKLYCFCRDLLPDPD